MIILVHSDTDESSLAQKLGRAEYSYYFVLRFFRPVLERIGLVIPVVDPARQVDPIYAQACARGEACVYLSFAPPHRTVLGLACPTIPVFAWEFDTIPGEHWGEEPRHNWVAVLRRLGRAVVHSEGTADVVRAALGRDFPVTSIPAPVWDHFAPPDRTTPRLERTTLSVRGTVIDTAALDMAALRHDENWVECVHMERTRRGRTTRVELDGVVYSSVFNPEDGRKNWPDMIGAFCRVFRDTPDATLVLKLTHHDGTWGMALMLRHLFRLMPFAARVVLIHGYLPDADYARLVAVTTFTVNTSHGEGQCLPLMEAMSAGKPAVAPPHTGMADYVHAGCAFLVDSSAEPAGWPQDGRAAIRTRRRRINLTTLEASYRNSYDSATRQPETYADMSLAAAETLRRHCSWDRVEILLRTLLMSGSAPPVSPDAPERSRMRTSYQLLAKLDGRLASLQYFQQRPPPNLGDYDQFDPSDVADRAALLRLSNFRGEAGSGNAILLHRGAKKALSETPIRMRGTGNIVIIDRNCAVHGSIDMTGDENLAVFEGDQSYLAISATFYGNDTLVWGRRASSWGIRVWVQGGTVCTIGEDCLFSENITIRGTDHHTIFDLDTGAQINHPAGVTIGRHVWVGQDCAIGKGVSIDDGSIIGARSLVVSDVGKAELWAGSPARKLRERVSWTLSHPAVDGEERDSVRALLA